MSLSKPVLPPPTLPAQVLTFLTWLEKTQGRDKLYRFIVYFSKWFIQTCNQHNVDPDIIARLASGASVVATSRKLFRFFRSLDYAEEALLSLALVDPVERLASIIKGGSLSVWLFCDHIQWLHKAGYIKVGPVSLKKIDTVYNQAWFFGLLFGCLLCIYRLTKLRQEEKLLRPEISRDLNSTSPPHLHTNLVGTARRALVTLEEKKAKQITGVVKNGLDLVIPAARLNWLNISDGTVGLAGTATSLIGMYETYPSAAAVKIKTG